MTNEADQPPPDAAALYCVNCGEACPLEARFCPACGAELSHLPAMGVRTLAVMLTEFGRLREQGIIDQQTYARLRAEYEPMLLRARGPVAATPPRVAPHSPTTPAAPSSPSGILRRVLDPQSSRAPDAVRPATPPRPPRAPRPTLSQWAATRQADILLYLGAFILSIAALIFAGYQGDALTGPGRFAILTAYTAAFLALGLLLPRWERVREAGPIFLALGAVLVPITMIALRTLVLDDSTLPDDVLTLAGSIGAGALYFALAVRGYGRFYTLPGALAAVIGWGALASVIGIPPHWGGPWYVGGAAALAAYAGQRRPSFGRWIELGAAIVAAFGLLAALIVAVDQERWLPATVAFALATAGGAAVVHGRRIVAAMALLPPLAVGTALAAWTATFGLRAEWTVPAVAVTGLGYLIVAHFDRQQRAINWSIVAAIFGGLSIYGAHAAARDAGTDTAVLPVTYALLLLGAAATYTRWRWEAALAALPPLAVATLASALWSAAGVSATWLGCWAALAGLGYLTIAEYEQSQQRWWRGGAAASGVIALLWAHSTAVEPGTAAAQLPITYALVLLGAAWDAARRRDAAVLVLPALGALTAGSTLWAAGVPARWWIYPGLAAAALILATERWWRQRPVLRDAGWPYALAAAIALPIAFAPLHVDHPAYGMASWAAGAAMLLAGAMLTHGALVRGLARLDIRFPFDEPTLITIERQMLARLSGLFLFAAAAYFNRWAGLGGADAAWVYAGLGALAWAGLAFFGAARRDLLGILAPLGVTATALGAVVARDAAGSAALILAIGAAGPALSVIATHRPLLWLIAAAYTALALRFAWRWSGLDDAGLPLAYTALAAVLCAALTPLRRYQRDERGWVIGILSWAPWAVAVVAAVLMVERRIGQVVPGEPLVRSREWAALVATVAATGAAVTLEGLRLGLRRVAIPGTAGLLLGGLLAIAIAQPENVQAYTLPAGLYLIALSLTFRYSDPFIGRHMAQHEALSVLGMLVLLLPAAEQGFAPDGAIFGLEIIAAGLALLALGLVLGARWLIAGGVLALSGVAARWLLTDVRPPFWLTLGLLGMLLLAVGLLLLLQREAWDRLRERLARWWLDGELMRDT